MGSEHRSQFPTRATESPGSSAHSKNEATPRSMAAQPCPPSRNSGGEVGILVSHLGSRFVLALPYRWKTCAIPKIQMFAGFSPRNSLSFLELLSDFGKVFL